MRVVGGKHRGRSIRAAPSDRLRPTLDRVRESVFNILDHGVDWAGIAAANVIDVFAGTGAYGLEALSRGAAHATFIDRDPRALAIIRSNAATLGEEGGVTLLKLNAIRLPPPPGAVRAPCRLAFLDPPYGSGLAGPTLEQLRSGGWLAPGSIAVVEIGAPDAFHPPPTFRLVDDRFYGAARVLFLRAI